jgi:hypothetical protein
MPEKGVLKYDVYKTHLTINHDTINKIKFSITLVTGALNEKLQERVVV